MLDTFGESITIRDFGGRLTDTIRIRSDGSFVDGFGKVIPTHLLGAYVLQSCYHPARGHKTEPVVPLPGPDLNTTGPDTGKYTASNS